MAKAEKTPMTEGEEMKEAETSTQEENEQGNDTAHKVVGYAVKYIGSAASYTLGTVRFEPGQSKEIDCAYREAAMESGKFEEV